MLSTLGLAGATAPPPFTIDALSAAPGSGGAIEEWLASVAAGGDAAEGEEAGAEHGGEGEEGEADELLVAGTAPNGPACACMHCAATPLHEESDKQESI